MSEHEAITRKAQPTWKPELKVPTPCHDVDRLPMYGMPTWGDAFTPRQLVALTTFSDLVQEAREHVKADYLGARVSRPLLGYEDAGETPALPGWHSRGYLPTGKPAKRRKASPSACMTACRGSCSSA